MSRALTSDERSRLRALFDRAADLPAAEREAFVELECGPRGELREALSRLLAGLEAEDVLERLQSPPEPAIGAVLGPYRLLERVGEGGMGQVYRAVREDAAPEDPHRTVALKLLRPEFLSSEARRRFEREGELLGRLRHAGIAQILDSGNAATEHGRRPYVTMELVQGEPLNDYAWSRKLPVRARLELVACVADAVQHAHQHGVIHRDLKPGNILVDADGQPKVLDFGIARLRDDDLRISTLWTNVGQILGTLAYMSPEQATGEPAAIDTRSDVYSLGVLLYELLAHRLPYDVAGKSLPEAVRVIQEEEPARLTVTGGPHHRDVEAIVRMALEKDRERRYPSAAALAADIRGLLRHESITARPLSRLYTLGRFVRRNRTVVTAALAVGLALLIGLAAAVRFGLQEAQQRRRAQVVSYRANLVVTLEALGRGNHAAATEIHEQAPPHLRGWEWHHLGRRWNRELARVAVPELLLATCLDRARVLAVDNAGGVHEWDALSGELTPVASWVTGLRPLALASDGGLLLAYSADELLLGDPRGAAPDVTFSLPRQTPAYGVGLSAISEDGRRVAVVCKGKHLYLLEVGREPEYVDYEPVEIRSVAFDAEGRRLAVRRDGLFQMWSTDPVELQWKESLSYGGVAFSPDRETLVAELRTETGRGAGLFFKDPASGVARRALGRERYGAYNLVRSGGLAFSADGRMLAVPFTDEGILLLDARAGSPVGPDARGVRLRRGDEGAVGYIDYGPGGDVLLAFSPGGETLLTASPGDRTLRLWRTGIDGSSRPCRGHAGPVVAVAFSADGALLASGCADGEARLWEPATGAALGVLPAPSPVHGLAFPHDDARLLCRAGDGLGVWDTALARAAPGAERCAGPLAQSGDRSVVAVGSPTGRVRLLESETLHELRLLGGEEDAPPTSLALDRAGTLLAAGTAEATVTLWDTASGVRLGRLETTRLGRTAAKGARCMAFAPDGRRLVVGWGDSSLTLHEVPTLDELRVMDDHRGEVDAVAFSPDGSRIASGGVDGALRLWDGTTGERLIAFEEHRGPIRALAFSPDGRRIATGSEDETVRIWDAQPVTEDWAARKARATSRVEAAALVSRLHEELETPEAVVKRLRGKTSLTADLRRAALHEVLGRQLQRTGAEGD